MDFCFLLEFGLATKNFQVSLRTRYEACKSVGLGLVDHMLLTAKILEQITRRELSSRVTLELPNRKSTYSSECCFLTITCAY